jgi:hypothetical protein
MYVVTSRGNAKLITVSTCGMSEDSKEADEKNNNKKQVSKKIVGKKYSVNMFQRSKHTQHPAHPSPDST